MNLARACAVVGVLTLLGSCNNIPISGLQKSFSVKVTVTKNNTEPVKVDFLWVIDNSASMCQEQASLADSFDDFLKRISSFVNIDYRIAVVTTEVADKKHSIGPIAGLFQANPASEFPFACAETIIRYCLKGDDAMCTQGYDRADLPTAEPLGNNWSCDAPNAVNRIVNCNGSLNSKCHKLCTSDAECDTQFFGVEQGTKCSQNTDDCRYKCLTPSGDPANSGCVLRPQTKQCPTGDDLWRLLVESSGRNPDKGTCNDGSECDIGGKCADGAQCPKAAPWLTPETAELYFKCVGVVGAEQRNAANLEQGLNAALFALDRQGPNQAQAKAFLRDDAYLVLVFVSDEDDCSVDDGQTLKKEKYGICTCLPDTNGGGKLRPVTEAVNRIKALKADPGRVLVAAIVGDSTADSEEAISQDRDAYFASKCSKCANPADQHPMLVNTYICESKAGKADFGNRYVQFVGRFGKNGILTNICSDTGVAPALDKIADRIIRVFTKVCLPRPILDTETLEIHKLGPKGSCGDGSACCTRQSNQCAEAETCADGTVCEPTISDALQQSEEQDTQTYRVAVSSDCNPAAGKKAVFFNFLLEPGSGVSIDYVAVPDIPNAQ